MNDREKAIHTYVMLQGFFKATNKDDPDMFNYLLDHSRLSMFATVTENEMSTLENEIWENQQSIGKFCEDMLKYVHESEK